MPSSVITLDRACDLARTGDIWVFRGSSGADRAIRGLTNAPVNHVGMAVVLDDLPPMMWHAELGRSLPDLWSGEHQRGVQLHDLRDAVLQWGHRYHQRPWLRQLEGPAGTEHEDGALEDGALEDGALRAIARLDGTPFPSTARLTGRWLHGRLPSPPWRRHLEREPAALATAYCAEVVALTYEEMGLLPAAKRANWYDPGRFWSGDDLQLEPPFRLGGEIGVTIPPTPATDAPEIAAPERAHSVAERIRRAIPPWSRRGSRAR